ncbi:MAG: AI-2E family transporter [Acidobacteriota bacterium]
MNSRADWWRSHRRWVIFIGVVASLYLLFYLMRSVAIPLLISSILAYLLDPVVEFLSKHRVPRSVSVLSMMLLAALIVVAFLMILIPAVVSQVRAVAHDFPEYTSTIMKYVEPYYARIERTYPGAIGKAVDKAVETARANAPQMLKPLLSFITHAFSSLMGFILSLLNVILIPVLTYFLLKDLKTIRKNVRELIPLRHRDQVVWYVRECDRVLGAFVRGQLTVCTILFFMYAVGLSLLRVPMSFFWALLGGYGNLIPYVGTFTSAAGSMLFSFMQDHSLKKMLLTGGVFVLAQTLEGTVISPRIVGGSVGVNPIIVMLAVIVGGNLFGLLGMLLAVPTVAVVSVFLKAGHQKYVSSDFYKGPAAGP